MSREPTTLERLCFLDGYMAGVKASAMWPDRTEQLVQAILEAKAALTQSLTDRRQDND